MYMPRQALITSNLNKLLKVNLISLDLTWKTHSDRTGSACSLLINNHVFNLIISLVVTFGGSKTELFSG